MVVIEHMVVVASVRNNEIRRSAWLLRSLKEQVNNHAIGSVRGILCKTRSPRMFQFGHARRRSRHLPARIQQTTTTDSANSGFCLFLFAIEVALPCQVRVRAETLDIVLSYETHVHICLNGG